MDCALIFIERECEGYLSGTPSLKRECDVALNQYRIIKLVNLQDNIYISAIKYSECDTLVLLNIQYCANSILLVLLTVLCVRLVVSSLFLLFSLAFLFSFVPASFKAFSISLLFL